MKVYTHKITGITGTFIKKYTPTGRGLTLMIMTDEGLFYYAPLNEFSLILKY